MTKLESAIELLKDTRDVLNSVDVTEDPSSYCELLDKIEAFLSAIERDKKYLSEK